MSLLYTELHRWAATPHQWGIFDCMTVLADWVMSQKGFDGAADLRGTYGNPDVCPIARGYRANPEPILERAFEPLPIVEEARPGDIALVQIHGQPFPCGALKTKTREWAMKPEDQSLLLFRHVKPVLIWGVGYEE